MGDTERIRAWRAANPEKAREQTRKASRRWTAKHPEQKRRNTTGWSRANPERVRAKQLRLKYNLTPAAWDALFATQHQRCACCRTDDPGQGGWQVDHDHETGSVRGILCPHCNRGLGHFRDKPDLLRAAAIYLENAREQTSR